MDPNDSILSIKGIGEKTAALYKKLGISTVEELLLYFPRAYEYFDKPTTIRDSLKSDYASIRAVVVSFPSIKYVKNIAVISTRLRDDNGDEIRATWYQMTYIAKTLRQGECYIFRGRFGINARTRFFEQPQVYALDKYELLMKSLQPVYSLTSGLSSQMISRSIKKILEGDVKLQDSLSLEVRKRHGLMQKQEACREMHFPADTEVFVRARKSIVFEEFYNFLMGVKHLKEELLREKNHFAIVKDSRVESLIAKLPYRLTDAQQRARNEIESDMTGHHMMNRMVQGDVGSGKTIVAFLAMYMTALSHYQSVLMAPTEVLAVQHYKSFCGFNDNYELGLNVVLLTGSLKSSEKRIAYENIKNGNVDIIVGTHALIQEGVNFKDLALAITDEQHRFGVVQRELLSKKGHTPHVLVMSATPIPRSLAMILYGDLDISVMDELPAKRLSIKNCVVDISYRPTAWRFIEREVRNGHQAYVICPLVEESDLIDCCDALSYSKKLSKTLPSEIKVGCLHGKMKAAAKTEMMDKFAQNEINVLVATTVIEVGIDVPNATVMLIEDAQRFGLAQLHQLRGRVGRGEYQSYCIMINTAGNDSSNNKRLDIMNHSNDGFEIAAEDLKLRGPGDFFGVRQSGEILFKVADIYKDAEILKAVSAEVNKEQRV